MPATHMQEGLIGGQVQGDAATVNKELRAEIRRSEKNFLSQQKRCGEELVINTQEEILRVEESW